MRPSGAVAELTAIAISLGLHKCGALRSGMITYRSRSAWS
jgi:hypothetical protein